MGTASTSTNQEFEKAEAGGDAAGEKPKYRIP